MNIRCLFADGKRYLILESLIVISFVQDVKTDDDRIRWQLHLFRTRSDQVKINLRGL